MFTSKEWTFTFCLIKSYFKEIDIYIEEMNAYIKEMRTYIA